jgi:ATP-dependent Clp protease protease subunit
MGSFLLMAGAAGKRYSLPNSRIMIHQPSGGAQGMASDIEIQAQEILRLKRTLIDIYAKHTGQKSKVLEDAMDRDRWLSSEEAKAFGLVDHVVASRTDIVPSPADKK